MARASSRDLAEATDTFVRALLESNPGMQRSDSERSLRLSQRPALGSVLVGRSALNETERVGVYTTMLADGNLFYYLTVVPQDEAEAYGPAFDRVGTSIRLNDR